MMTKRLTTGIVILLEFLLVYAVSSAMFNQMIEKLGRAGIWVILLYAIYDYRRGTIKNTILPDKWFNLSYWPFFLLIIVSSALIGYADSLSTAYSYSRYAVLTFLVCYFLFQREFHGKSIIFGIIGGTLTICADALHQFLILPLGTRISAECFSNHPNLTCMLLIVSIPFLVLCIIHRKKYWHLLLLPIALINCFVIAVTGSRGGIMGLFCGGIVFLLIHTIYVRKLAFRKLLTNYIAVLAVILCVGGTCYVVFHQSADQQHQQVGVTRSYDSQRLLFWQSSYHMWQDHKILGVGLEHWEQEYYSKYILPEATEKGITFPHNTFFSFLSMTGLIGTIGYLLFTIGMFFYLCYKLKKYPNDLFLNALLWSFLALMIHGLLDIGFMNHSTMILFNAYLGIGLASVAYQERISK